MKQIAAELEHELKKQAKNLLTNSKASAPAPSLSLGIIFAGWRGRRRLRH